MMYCLSTEIPSAFISSIDKNLEISKSDISKLILHCIFLVNISLNLYMPWSVVKFLNPSLINSNDLKSFSFSCIRFVVSILNIDFVPNSKLEFISLPYG